MKTNFVEFNPRTFFADCISQMVAMIFSQMTERTLHR